VTVTSRHRELEIKSLLDEIVDPCSVAAGTRMGLVEMGIVDCVEVRGESVSITLLPTFPGCIYTAVFAEEITRRLERLSWLDEIRVEQVEGSIWDEDHMSSRARERLQTARAERRRRLELLSDGNGQLRHQR
jgi:metal-sulfur cluster biosynthetic enzyme